MKRRSFFRRLAALVAVGPLAKLAPPMVSLQWHKSPLLKTHVCGEFRGGMVSMAKPAQRDYNLMMTKVGETIRIMKPSRYA